MQVKHVFGYATSEARARASLIIRAVLMALQRRENAELCDDPSDFEVRMDEGEAHAKTRRPYDRVATGTGRLSGWGEARCALTTALR